MARRFRRVGPHVIELDGPRQYVAIGLRDRPAGELVSTDGWTAQATQSAVEAGRIAPVLVPNGYELRAVKP